MTSPATINSVQMSIQAEDKTLTALVFVTDDDTGQQSFFQTDPFDNTDSVSEHIISKATAEGFDVE